MKYSALVFLKLLTFELTLFLRWTMRDMLVAMRDVLKLSNGNIFGINLFLTNVKAGLIF